MAVSGASSVASYMALNPPPTKFQDGRRHAKSAKALARSYKVPSGALKRADELWRESNPDTPFGDSYRAMTPSKHFEQQFGLVISTAVSSHLLRTNNLNRSKLPPQCYADKSCKCREDDPFDLLDDFDFCVPSQMGTAYM